MSKQKTAGSLGLSEAPNTCHAGYLVNWFNVKSHLYRILKVYEYNMVQAMNLSKTFPSALVGKQFTVPVGQLIACQSKSPWPHFSLRKGSFFAQLLTKLPFFAAVSLMQNWWICIPPPRNRPPIHQRVVQRTPEETSSISTLKRMEFNGVFCARMGWILRKNAIWQVWWWWWGGWWGWLETKPFYERGPTPLPMIEMSQNLWPIQAVLNMIGKVYSGCLNRGIRETIGVNHKTVLENIFCGIHLPSPENPWKPTMGSHKHPRTSPCKRHTKNDMWNTPNSQMDKTDKTTFNLLSSLRQMFFPPDKYGFLKPSYGGGSFHPISISVYTLVISSRKNHIIASKIETYRNQIIVESDKQIAPFVELMA